MLWKFGDKERKSKHRGNKKKELIHPTQLNFNLVLFGIQSAITVFFNSVSGTFLNSRVIIRKPYSIGAMAASQLIKHNMVFSVGI